MENATITRQKALALKANDFERRFQPRLWEGRHWDIALCLDRSDPPQATWTKALTKEVKLV
jgi:hypothetical protein